jgi:ribosomal protein L20A (L18A)
MKLFEVKGEFTEKKKKRKFTKTIKAASHRFAAEKALCLMGSKHRVKRRHIVLLEIKEKEAGEGNGGETS